MNLTTLGTSHKQNHTIFVLWGSGLFTYIMFSRLIHITVFIKTSLPHAFALMLMDRWFLPLTIINNAAGILVSTWSVQVLLPVLLGVYLGVELVDYMIILCLIFEEMPNCFPFSLLVNQALSPATGVSRECQGRHRLKSPWVQTGGLVLPFPLSLGLMWVSCVLGMMVITEPRAVPLASTGVHCQ